MINIENVKSYCGEDISLIENYDKAVSDTTQMWDCHHIWETMLGYSKQELIDMDEYYGVPACNLIFLTHAEHSKIHKIGSIQSEEIRKKISEANKGEKHCFFGKHLKEEHRKKISESNIGKKHTEEARKKMSEFRKGKNNTKKSKPVLQFTINGVFIKEWPSAREIERTLKFKQSNVSSCCTGKLKTAYGYIWKYKEN